MPSSSVPIIPLHAPEDMVLAIERLREKADSVGEGTLGYLLLMAEIEARGISDRARLDAENAEAAHKDLWRPA